jgi:hypothetical protein
MPDDQFAGIATLAIASRVHQQLLAALAGLDELGCHQAGAHASMAIDALEKKLGDLLACGAAKTADSLELPEPT